MSTDERPEGQTFSSRELRDALGQFCTGITVITAANDGEPVGFACQSFSALSLDPPLILFCPMKTSGSWKGIEKAGRFAVNILSEDRRRSPPPSAAAATTSSPRSTGPPARWARR